MKKSFSIVFFLLIILTESNCSAATLIFDFPCEKVVNVGANLGDKLIAKDGHLETKYAIYHIIGKQDTVLLVSPHCYENVVISNENGNEHLDGYYYSTIDGLTTDPKVAAEEILTHHIITGELKGLLKNIDYIFFASSHTDRFPKEVTLPVSGVPMYILQVNDMYTLYKYGNLKIWEGNPDV